MTIPRRSTVVKSFVVARYTAGPCGSEGRAGDREALELLDPDGARVLEAPLLALDSFLRREERLRLDAPAVDAVRRARDREVGDAGERLDAREQNGLAVDDRGRRIEDGVHGNRPVLRREQRIVRDAA